MTNKELVIGFFREGYVHHNYDFLMEHMAADYFDKLIAVSPVLNAVKGRTELRRVQNWPWPAIRWRL